MSNEKQAAAHVAGIGPGGPKCLCCKVGSNADTKRAMRRVSRRLAKIEIRSQIQE